MSDPLYDKLAFNGFNVTYWNHETQCIEEESFPTYESVIERKWPSIPTAQEFAAEQFDVWGDCVGIIKDNSGRELYNDYEAMMEMYREFR